MPLCVSTLIGDCFVVDQVFISCVVIVSNVDAYVNHIILAMVDVDVILGMEWFSHYHVVIEYFSKTVTLVIPNVPLVMW